MPEDSTLPKRGLLIFGGIVSLLAGIFAIAAPGIFSTLLTEFLGALLLVTGVVGLFQALLGKISPIACCRCSRLSFA
jgi:uncharacterized membrane protein HdeD (DUF308 family)